MDYVMLAQMGLLDNETIVQIQEDLQFAKVLNKNIKAAVATGPFKIRQNRKGLSKKKLILNDNVEYYQKHIAKYYQRKFGQTKVDEIIVEINEDEV